VKEVARKLYFAIGTSGEDEAHNRLRNRLFELIRESFDELIYPSEYGALVKQYRKNNLLTQQDFAIQSGIALRTVQNIEQGKSLYNQTIKKLNNFFEKQNEQTRKD
jgi:DNA-binding XRE family transcriptional regulator